MRRGAVWLCKLDPTRGSEIQKTRPCAILSPDALNERLRTVIVAPLTTGSRPARFRLATRFQARDGFILLEQVRTVDRSRLVRYMGDLDGAFLDAALAILRDMFEE